MWLSESWEVQVLHALGGKCVDCDRQKHRNYQPLHRVRVENSCRMIRPNLLHFELLSIRIFRYKFLMKNLKILVGILNLNKLCIWPHFCHFKPAKIRWFNNHVVLPLFNFVWNAGKVSGSSTIYFKSLDYVFVKCIRNLSELRVPPKKRQM